MFSMTMIVMADNLAMTFIGWEMVGFSSYLLIGHWFNKESAADAAKKAFITNRVGDFGFLIGILLTMAVFGTLTFSEMGQPPPAYPPPYSPPRYCACSAVRSVNPPSSRCMYGCRTPWKAPPRYPHSSTPPPWWPPVYTCWYACK